MFRSSVTAQSDQWRDLHKIFVTTVCPLNFFFFLSFFFVYCLTIWLSLQIIFIRPKPKKKIDRCKIFGNDFGCFFFLFVFVQYNDINVKAFRAFDSYFSCSYFSLSSTSFCFVLRCSSFAQRIYCRDQWKIRPIQHWMMKIENYFSLSFVLSTFFFIFNGQ